MSSTDSLSSKLPPDATAEPVPPPPLDALLPEVTHENADAAGSQNPDSSKVEEIVSESVVPTLETKLDAYRLFLTTDRPLCEIALMVKVPTAVLQNWVESERWGARKLQYFREIARRLESEYAVFALQERTAVAKRQLRIARILEEEIEWSVNALRNVRPDLTTTTEKSPDAVLAKRSRTLLTLSQALKTASDVSSRLVSLTSDYKALEESDRDRAPTNTIIVIGGKAKPAPTEKQVTLDSDGRPTGFESLQTPVPDPKLVLTENDSLPAPSVE